MSNFKEKIDFKKIPVHVAIIMDGNGRWAKQRNKDRFFGHREGVNSVKAVVEAAGELGIKYLTLYAFSSENWSRPKEEIELLMSLLVQGIRDELDNIIKQNIKIIVIGDLSKLKEEVRKQVEEAMERSKDNKGLNLIIALSYSGRDEIVYAVRQIANKVKNGKLNVEEINREVVSSHLYTVGIPDPDLMIRTSGEIRISNFLLWQISYTELYFTSILWPDFKKEQFFEAIYNYQLRERRFGKISEQLSK